MFGFTAEDSQTADFSDVVALLDSANLAGSDVEGKASPELGLNRLVIEPTQANKPTPADQQAPPATPWSPPEAPRKTRDVAP